MAIDILLFRSRSEEAAPLIANLRAAGYAVADHESPQHPSLRHIAAAAPAAIVIDLSRLPSHGRALGTWLRGSKSTRHFPLVFVGGEPAKVDLVRAAIPDAAYTAPADILRALKKSIAKPLAQPVTPPPMMQSYASRTTAQKLGIREGSSLGLIDPPGDYARVLGELPHAVVIEEDPARACDVTLWFIHDPHDYAAQLRKYRTRRKLWIVWKKARRDGMNGTFVRQAARAVGLVDYKICSLDGVWSGMVFAIKKAPTGSPA